MAWGSGTGLTARLQAMRDARNALSSGTVAPLSGVRAPTGGGMPLRSWSGGIRASEITPEQRLAYGKKVQQRLQ